MKNLRSLISLFITGFALVLFSGCLGSGHDSSSDFFSLTIVHVNDTHSQMEALPDQPIIINNTTTYVDIAGMPRLATKIASARARNKNTLLLHAGDAVQGTLYFTRYEGKAEFDFLNRMGFEAMAIGNHEFDKGPSYLAKFIDYADFPVISADIDSYKEPGLANKFQPYTIITLEGQSIGIIGLTTIDTPNISSSGDNLVFEDDIASAAKYVAELESKGINKIIALTHLGYERDKLLGSSVSGIDLIVGGHSHTLLGGSDMESLGLKPYDEYPATVHNPDGETVYIVQAWEKAKVAGLLDITFDSDGKVSSASGRPVILAGDNFRQKNGNGDKEEVDETTRESILSAIKANDSIEVVSEDPDSLALLETYKSGIEQMTSEVIGKAGDDLFHTRIPFTDTLITGEKFPSGSYIAPHVAQSMLWKVNQNGKHNADLAIKGAGGVRINIPKGDIFVSTAYELLPFTNNLVILELSGRELKLAIQGGISTAVTGGSSGAYPYVAGGRYTVDAFTNPKEPLVTDIEIKNSDDAYTPLDESATYRIVVDSFLAEGGDFYSTIANASGYRYDTGFIDVEAFIDYVKSEGTIYRLLDTGIIYKTEP